MKILVVDDKRSARRVVKHMLGQLDDVQVVEAATLDEARTAVQEQSPELLLVDIRLSDEPTDRGGLELLRWVRQSGDSVPVVMITASSELAEIREAMRNNAQDYVLKDELGEEMLLPIIQSFQNQARLRGEVTRLRQKVQTDWGTAAIVGSSPSMEHVRQLIRRVADSDVPVLIRGETGTGKEMVARALHECSSRRDQPFAAVNCSALPGTLIESMIFGHEKGAFTNAEHRHRGELEMAGAGTVLLDEIAEMQVELQAKLLRVLEERCFRPVGSEKDVALRARTVASTHADLESLVREGKFREDLYYRLNVVTIQLPSLSEHIEDLPELLRAFSSELSRKIRFSNAAVDWLKQRSWPGNVRELRNAVARLALLSDDDEIGVAALDELVGASMGNPAMEVVDMAKGILSLPGRVGSKLDFIERAVLHHAVEVCSGNKSAAARLIGLDRRALDRKLGRFSEEP